MKKEIKYAVITLMVMCVITILSLTGISLCAYTLKWQSGTAMQGITFTYIVTGLAGGLLRGALGRRKTIGILQAFLYGIVFSSLYWGVPGGILMFTVKEHISDIGNFALCWVMMAGSITAGILLMTGNAFIRSGKVKGRGRKKNKGR